MNFGILVFDDVEELDFVGPWEMLTVWREVANGPENCLLVSESESPVTCAKGLSINPHVSFADCPRLDCLLVPGGRGTRREVGNPVLVDFVASRAKQCRAVLSVCTGSFILHAAGLLSGRRATTHWGSLERLRALGDVEVVEARFVRDGNLWSSAGISAGIDLMLAFIADVSGEDAAGQVQFRAEYYPASTRYGGYGHHAQTPAYLGERRQGTAEDAGSNPPAGSARVAAQRTGEQAGAMHVDAIDHLVLTVRDIEAACAFYARVLGMGVATFAGGRRALTFGSQKINLHRHGREFEPMAKAPTPGSADLCLLTSVPIGRVLDHLRAAGTVVLEGPVRRTGATGPITSVYFRDPDGNLIEVANPGPA